MRSMRAARPGVTSTACLTRVPKTRSFILRSEPCRRGRDLVLGVAGGVAAPQLTYRSNLRDEWQGFAPYAVPPSAQPDKHENREYGSRIYGYRTVAHLDAAEARGNRHPAQHSVHAHYVSFHSIHRREPVGRIHLAKHEQRGTRGVGPY